MYNILLYLYYCFSTNILLCLPHLFNFTHWCKILQSITGDLQYIDTVATLVVCWWYKQDTLMRNVWYTHGTNMSARMSLMQTSNIVLRLLSFIATTGIRGYHERLSPLKTGIEIIKLKLSNLKNHNCNRACNSDTNLTGILKIIVNDFIHLCIK